MPIDANELVPSLWATLQQPAPTNTWPLGSPTLAWSNLYLGSGLPVLDPTTGIIGYIPPTAAEIAAAASLSIPVSTLVAHGVYLPGDLRRYGCDITGATDNSTQIGYGIAAATASGGCGYIYHPGGTISHASQITLVNNLTVLGFSRALSVFRFTGSPSGSPAATRSAWRYTGVAPWSGFANVFMRHVKIQYVNAIAFAAGIELSAWGWAYLELDDVWVTGSCSFGVILDGTEICSLHNSLIENTNATININVWIVNGADRGFTQGTGFSNVITLRENQISAGAGATGLQDDGGNAHVIQNNNFNGHRFPAIIAGCSNFQFTGNSLETLLTSGSANLLLQSISSAGNPVNACTGGLIAANGFYGGMSAGSLLTFQGSTFNVSAATQATNGVVTFSTASSVNPFATGAQIAFTGIVGMTQLNGQSVFVTAIGGTSGAWTVTLNLNTSVYTAYVSGGTGRLFHSGIVVQANTFGAQSGRGGAIDVTNLANSLCTANNDQAMVSPGGPSMSHYAGVHNDVWGNRLDPPQNGGVLTANLGIAGPTAGDSRFGFIFTAGVGSNGATAPAQLTGWGTPTGAAVQNNFAGGAATLATLGAAMAEIIAYLKSKGDFGA